MRTGGCSQCESLDTWASHYFPSIEQGGFGSVGVSKALALHHPTCRTSTILIAKPGRALLDALFRSINSLNYRASYTTAIRQRLIFVRHPILTSACPNSMKSQLSEPPSSTKNNNPPLYLDLRPPISLRVTPHSKVSLPVRPSPTSTHRQRKEMTSTQSP